MITKEKQNSELEYIAMPRWKWGKIETISATVLGLCAYYQGSESVRLSHSWLFQTVLLAISAATASVLTAVVSYLIRFCRTLHERLGDYDKLHTETNRLSDRVTDLNDQLRASNKVVADLCLKFNDSKRIDIDVVQLYEHEVWLRLWKKRSAVPGMVVVVIDQDTDLYLGKFRIDQMSGKHLIAKGIYVDPVWYGYLLSRSTSEQLAPPKAQAYIMEEEDVNDNL